MVRPSEWSNHLLRFTPLPKDLCQLIVEYLDCRPNRLFCAEEALTQRDKDYLTSQGIIIIPDTKDIVDISSWSDDNGHRLVACGNVHIKVIDLRDTTTQQYPIDLGAKHGSALVQFGSMMILRDRSGDLPSLHYRHLNDRRDWSPVRSNLPIHLGLLYGLPVCNNSMYELYQSGESIELRKVITFKDDEFEHHHMDDSIIDHAVSALYAVDEVSNVIYCLTDTHFTRYDINSTDKIDKVNKVPVGQQLTKWVGKMVEIRGFAVYAPKRGHDQVEVVVSSKRGIDRYNSVTDKWTYDDHGLHLSHRFDYSPQVIAN